MSEKSAILSDFEAKKRLIAIDRDCSKRHFKYIY